MSNTIKLELVALENEITKLINSQKQVTSTINDLQISIEKNNENTDMIKQYNDYFNNLILDS